MSEALPSKVNILGLSYTIDYVDCPTEVDVHNRESCFGQIDYWTRTIRVYKKDQSVEAIWRTLLHEVLHGIANDLNLSLNEENKHKELDVLSIALADFLIRNGLLITCDFE
jgi:hypothetical protein